MGDWGLGAGSVILWSSRTEKIDSRGEYYFNSCYATNGKSMATDKYPEHKVLNPFFDVVMKGLNGLVDGEHYYDAIAENAQFEFLYRFPGCAEVIHDLDNLITACSGYGTNT